MDRRPRCFELVLARAPRAIISRALDPRGRIRLSATLLACGLVAILGSREARAAQRVLLEMDARPKRVAVGEQITVEVTLQLQSSASTGILRGGHTFSNYRKPGLEGFEILRTWNSRSTRLEVGGGRTVTVQEHSFYYVVSPRKEGKLTISPAQVTVSGRTFRSNRLTVTVTSGPTAPPPARPGQAPALQSDDEIAVQVIPDKTEVWLSEQVTVTWYLYTRTALARQPTIKSVPSTDHFFAEEIPLERRKATRTVINGVEYAVVPMYRRALFPMKTGDLRVGSLTVEAMAIGDSYYSLSPVVRSSAPLDIRVKPLPSASEPPGFHPNNVGRFSIAAEVDPVQLDAQDAASLRLVVSGTGFVPGMKLDKIKKIDGFKVRFAGQKTDLERQGKISGKLTHEYVLIPTRTGKVRVPPVCFPHFDPGRGQYVSDACTDGVTLTVTGSLSRTASGQAASATENELRRQIKPILRGELVARSRWRLHRSWLLWPLVLLPIVALTGILLVRGVRSRARRDSATRRRREARRSARQRLRRAHALLREGNRPRFFAEVSAALQELLSARLGVPIGGLTSTELDRRLAERGMEPELRSRLLRELEICDFARFAPAASSSEQAADVIQRARRLVGDIDRANLREGASHVDEEVAS